MPPSKPRSRSAHSPLHSPDRAGGKIATITEGRTSHPFGRYGSHSGGSSVLRAHSLRLGGAIRLRTAAGDGEGCRSLVACVNLIDLTSEVWAIETSTDI